MRSIARTEAHTSRTGHTWLGPQKHPAAIGARVIALARVASAIHMAHKAEALVVSDANAQAGMSRVRDQEAPS
ncbi:MAG: hypothetical protein ACYTF7_07455 [Planctomycetota bacterium]